MHYVYILQSIKFPSHYYTGITEDLNKRVEAHNRGECPHTKKYKPWHIKTAILYTVKEKAYAFEKYLKTPSGRAFAKKRL
ncbi:MAG: GIY-YIG nuclease family protein [Candidatus Omnitrophota bacterium]